MDRCGGKRSGYRFTACPNQPKVPHFGLSAPIRHYKKLKALQGYLWSLPKPVLSAEDIAMAQNETNMRLIQYWDVSRNGPIKRAVILTMCSTFGRTQPADSDIVFALTQQNVSLIHFPLLGVEGCIAKSVLVPFPS
jgi:hypothetical protein